jgi:arylsulfatase
LAALLSIAVGARWATAQESPGKAPSAASRPNIVLIFADDLGYGDLGCYGAKGHTTPNLDRLAAEGARFTRFYVAQPVCSASRAALLTGCYSSRVSIFGALGPDAKIGVSDRETTIAELAKQAGYATAAIGKWHLGHRKPFLPTRHGFDEYLGLPYSNDMWPQRFEPGGPEADAKRQNVYPNLPLIEGDEPKIARVTADDQSQLTTWYAERAVDFIERHKQAPFFLYLADSMPHVPLYVSDKFKGKAADGLYGDVIEEVDWQVGQIMAALDRNGLAEKTLVVFTSDNGPWLTYGAHGGSAGPLREGKGTCWEGGVREPCVARWPGQIPAGTVCREPAMTIDLLPTFARLMGAQLPQQKIDGLDIWPLLTGELGAKCPHEAYYFYYRKNELQAVMSGPWKLYLPHSYTTLAGQTPGRDGKPGRYQTRKIESPELYNVEADIGETTNMAESHADIVRRLQGYAEQARAELGDSLTGRVGSGVRPTGAVD